MLLLVFRDELVRLIMTVDRPLSAGATVALIIIGTVGLVAEARRRFKRSELLNG